MEITANFRAFFDALKFNRTVEDNSAIDAALLALVKGRKTLNRERVGRACRRVLHISYRMLDKASKRRDSMFELDNIHYKPAGKAECKSAISSTAIKALSEALHTDESLTMPDNDRKGSTPVYWVDDQGVRMFDRHPNRVVLLGNRVELLDYLRGTTRSHCASLFVFEMAGLQPLLETTEAKRVELSNAFTRLTSSSMQAAGVTMKPKDCFSIMAVGGGAMATSVRGLKKKQAEQGIAVIMANDGDGDGDRFSAPTDNAATAPVDDAELVDPRDAAEIKFDSVKLTYYTTGAPIKDPHPAWVQFQLMTSTLKKALWRPGQHQDPEACHVQVHAKAATHDLRLPALLQDGRMDPFDEQAPVPRQEPIVLPQEESWRRV